LGHKPTFRSLYSADGESFAVRKQRSELVEAAGVEPEMSAQSTQLIDSEKARIGTISRTAKSTVRSLYSLFPELPELPKHHLQTAPNLAKEHSEVLS
jgi:hypothetical protein